MIYFVYFVLACWALAELNRENPNLEFAFWVVFVTSALHFGGIAVAWASSFKQIVAQPEIVQSLIDFTDVVWFIFAFVGLGGVLAESQYAATFLAVTLCVMLVAQIFCGYKTVSNLICFM